MISTTPEFLFVKPGDYVAIKKDNCENTKEKNKNYWIGQVIDCIGGARNPNSWTLFQVANIDNGEITIINADIVEKINGRLAMGGLIYLVFTKLVSNRADILDQLKSYLI